MTYDDADSLSFKNKLFSPLIFKMMILNSFRKTQALSKRLFASRNSVMNQLASIKTTDDRPITEVKLIHDV